MIMAFFIWMLGKFGVAPTADDLARMDRQARERGHHVWADFGGQRFGGTRWTDDEFRRLLMVGVGYAYLFDRRYNGVALEVTGQSLGAIFHRGGHEWFLGGGLGYYPIRQVHLFMHGGALFEGGGDVRGVGRLGIGYRMRFFMLSMQPFAYVQTTTNGKFGWALGFRIEY